GSRVTNFRWRDNEQNPAKICFTPRPVPGDFIRPNHRDPTKTYLFLFVALTIQGVMAKSIIRSCLIGSRDLTE
ncbi:MAG TPA: hypothetical protein VK749_19250, partial [Xanthobacteraceae bacterium]|nr:hypothetical protein [Xanthobacteraceae bacterium]